MQQARGLARVVALACVVAAATITCVPPAAVPPGGGGAPAPVDGDAGGSTGGGSGADADGGVATAGDAGEAIDAGAAPPGSTIDAVVAAVDRAPPPRTLDPERPSAPPPALQYPLDVAPARTADALRRQLELDEGLLATTARADPERPALLWRLATDYRHLAIVSGSAQAVDEATAAERAQLAKLATLRTEYPKWCAAPNPSVPSESTGCGDEQTYLAARGRQRLGEPAEARKLYLSLIQTWPSSRLVAGAYAALGEMFLVEAAADPSKLALAEQSFGQVVVRPPLQDPLFAQARHRLAYIAWRKGDFAHALTELKHTITVSQQYASMPGMAAMGERARADLIPIYVLVGDPMRAHDFLRPLAGDTGSGNERTIAWLERLRVAYTAAGAYPAAVTVLQDLDNRDGHPPRACARAVDRLELTAWALATAGERVEPDLASLLAGLDREWSGELLAACRARAAGAAITVLLARDLDVVGSDAAPGPRAPAAVARVVELYRAAALTFTDDELAAASYPRLPAGFRPTRAWLQVRADLLAPLTR